MANATRRIVLERRTVVDPPQRLADALEVDAATPYEAWVEVAREDGATSDEAVDKYAGKSFSEGAKPGVRRAVSLQAWGSARITEA